MVQLTSLFTATTLFAATLVKAGCYTTGASWGMGDRDAANHAFRACNGYSSNGQHVKGRFENVWFKSYAESSAPATACINLGGAKHIVFQVTNLAGGRTLPTNVCYDGLQWGIWSCARGGEYGTDNWSFRSDINEGNCP